MFFSMVIYIFCKFDNMKKAPTNLKVFFALGLKVKHKGFVTLLTAKDATLARTILLILNCY